MARSNLILALAILTLSTPALTGCAIKEDLGPMLGDGTPTPTEAAIWMFHRDPERRRLGIALIADSPFGGEEPYLKVYREAVRDTDPMVRAASAHALGLHGQAEDAPLLIPMLDDRHQMVRWEAAQALQRIHHENAVGPLLDAALNDPDADVRAAAATALGQYAEPRVLEGLVEAIDDRSLIVNDAARRSLRILTGQDFQYDLERWQAWLKETDAPFAQRRQYYYPVYKRDLSLREKMMPFGKPHFDQPGIPRGMEPIEPAAAAENAPHG